MTSHEPKDEPSGGTYDTLRRLERRLDEASAAAERLIAQAASGSGGKAASGSEGKAASGSGGKAASESGGKTPPAGWQAPEDDAGSGVDRGGDLEVLVRVLEALRDLIPPELEKRLAEALREVLLALRALIDWYLERAERQRAAPSEVQDIPIV
jgi:hypothetical protein